jgi:hypothetical protein
MNEGLFKKHIRQILSHVDAKEKIILAIFEKTGIQIEGSEITLSKKTVTLSMSSVKKSAFLQAGGKDIVSALGYTLQA